MAVVVNMALMLVPLQPTLVRDSPGAPSKGRGSSRPCRTPGHCQRGIGFGAAHCAWRCAPGLIHPNDRLLPAPAIAMAEASLHLQSSAP